MSFEYASRIHNTCVTPYVQDFSDKRPLLAHYTSIQVIESIIKNETVWFSNPRFMNDRQEYEFGISLGQKLLLSHPSIEKLALNPAFLSVRERFLEVTQFYEKRFSYDIFALCFCQHDESDRDGLLSMWRAYGGQGAGAALVLDTKRLESVSTSPISLTKIIYCNAEERTSFLNKIIADFCVVVEDAPSLEVAHFCVDRLFDALKYHALTMKDRGFSEEKEWRAIYFPERDAQSKLREYIDYHISPAGLEPKFKIPLKPIEGALGDGVSLETLLYRVILGPTRSTTLARESFSLMLRKLQRSDWDNRVYGSTIPLRERFGSKPLAY